LFSLLSLLLIRDKVAGVYDVLISGLSIYQFHLKTIVYICHFLIATFIN